MADSTTPSDGRRVEGATASLYADIHGYLDTTGDYRRRWYEATYAPERLGVGPDFLAGKAALDAGCGGKGLFLMSLFLAGSRDITAVDLSPDNIDNARQANQDIAQWVRFRRMNLLEDAFEPASFDHIHCNGVVHHTRDPAAAVRNLAAALKPGGTLYLGVYGKGGLLSGLIGLLRLLARLVPLPVAKGLALRVFNPAAARDIVDYLYVPLQFRFTEDEARRLLTQCGITEVRRLPQPLPVDARWWEKYLRTAHMDPRSWWGRLMAGHGWIVLLGRKPGPR